MTNRSRAVIVFAVAWVTLIVLGLALSTPKATGILAAAFLLGFLISLFFIRREHSQQRTVKSSVDSALDQRAEFSPVLLETTINEMREGLVIIDREMRVTASNRAARNLFSRAQDSIGGRRLTELTRNPAIYDAFLDAVRGKERAGVKVETYDGGKKIFDLRVVPLRHSRSDDQGGAMGIFFDVTRLERLETVRQEFLSNVSHELRTPLTSIIALAETLEAGALDDSANNRRFLSIIQKNAARMHRLIDDILELSAIEAGTVKVEPERVQLRPIVDEVFSTMAAVAKDHDVTLENRIAPEAVAFADPYRLIQMLTNLVDNGIKFNRAGGGVTVSCEVGLDVRIHVEDTGEGIPSHHLERLFERFYRVDRARSRELGGTGLGLAIVKHLARAQNGEVFVESRFGQGTKFTIQLPAKSG